MPERLPAWSGALTVTVATTVLVVLDITDRPVHRYWSRHSFTSSVVAGLLVLLLTVLIVDRVVRMRQVRNQSRAIAAQATIIVSQAERTADAIARSSSPADGRDEAAGELRTYTQMLFTSAPVLIDATTSRAFLEAAQRVAGQLFRALRDGGGQEENDRKRRLDAAMAQLREAAAPLLAALNRDQRMAISSHEADSRST